MFATLILATALLTEPLTLIVNSATAPGEPPRHFRIDQQLKASGSGQFSENGLKTILSRIPAGHAITIVDLRQESHGFVNGIAVSWYAPKDQANMGKTLGQIETDETEKLQGLLQQKKVTLEHILSKPQDVIAKTSPLEQQVEKVSTEKALTENYKLGYLRLPITDHYPPPQEQVDRFLAFVKQLPPNSWLHFHCEAGEGRTTTFMCLYDIVRNGHRDSLETILDRQHKLGGIDLRQFPDPSNWKRPFAEQRLQSLKEFYNKLKATEKK